MWHVWGTEEVYTGLWWRNLRVGRPKCIRKNNIKMDLHEVGCGHGLG